MRLCKPALDKLDRFLDEAGRSRAAIGIEPRLHLRLSPPAQWAPEVAAWAAVGATHLTVSTLGCGYDTPAEHLAALASFAAALGLSA